MREHWNSVRQKEWRRRQGCEWGSFWRLNATAVNIERPGHLRLVATVLGLKRNFLRDINVWQTASPGRNPCCLARRTVDGCFRAEPEICSASVVAQSRFHRDGDPYTGAFYRSE